jgi:hypothetical protein
MRYFVAKVVCLAAFLIFCTLPASVLAANLSISPTSGTFKTGDKITVRVLVSSDIPINAISGVVSVPTNLFTVESVFKAGSILNFWVSEPNFSQGAGNLNFEGVALSGFNGGTGTVISMTLRAVRPGNASISFESGQVLANDGLGSNVTDRTIGATYSIVQAIEVPDSDLDSEPSSLVDEPQPSPSLQSPEIMMTTKFGEQAISGDSNYPHAQVLLTFISEGGVKVFITDSTDDLGQFAMLIPKTLKRGVYKVHAVVIQPSLANSHTSNEITISVGSFISDIGWEIRLAILLLILVLIYLLIRSYYYLKKNKKLRIFVRKEAQEAEGIVHKSFDILREDVGHTKEIKKDLDEAEDVISKEIKDIEKS